MKKIVLCCLLLFALKAVGQKADTRVFELRTYYAEAGKLDALIRRFQKHTTRLFKKHGMENIGYWVPLNNEKNILVYVLAFPDLAAREAAWKAFGADPKWKKVQSESERNGKLVAKVESVFMKATDFSPAIGSSKKGNRVFELRTYTVAPGKLEALKSRFRDHTVTLLSKHGATHIAYWTALPKDGEADKLVYILAHGSEAAGQKTWVDFRADPDWVSAKAASEQGGILAERVESVYMKPLPFSRIK